MSLIRMSIKIVMRGAGAAGAASPNAWNNSADLIDSIARIRTYSGRFGSILVRIFSIIQFLAPLTPVTNDIPFPEQVQPSTTASHVAIFPVHRMQTMQTHSRAAAALFYSAGQHSH